MKVYKQTLIWYKNSQATLSHSDYHWTHEPIVYGWGKSQANNAGKHYFTEDQSLTTVLEFPKPASSPYHPTMKPLKLIGLLVFNSTKNDELVIDFCAGSGTTLIACQELGRICYSAEIEPKYCNGIIHRWEKQTGLKAVKEE
jgi:site-specific DNA-methyltransferase (adenine-specific)